MSKIAKLLILLSLIFSFPSYAKPTPAIKRGVAASVMVVVEGVGSGSGFAIARRENRTLIMTNDHVCQMTRGQTSLRRKVNYSSKINTLEIVVVDSNDHIHKGKVVKTSNLHLLKEGQKGSDLCLLSVEGVFAAVAFSKEEMEVGDKVFSVGAPHGVYPMVHEGYVGPSYKSDSDDNKKEVRITTLLVWPGSSGSAVYDYDTGLVVGVIYAIQPVDSKINVPVMSVLVPGDQARDFLRTYQEATDD
jgi:S1-C subfamily serine protease